MVMVENCQNLFSIQQDGHSCEARFTRAAVSEYFVRHQEPPALLTEPLAVHLDRSALAQLNDYRQAQHAWLGCTGDATERNRLHKVMEGFGALLAMDIANQVALQLGEPANWAADE